MTTTNPEPGPAERIHVVDGVEKRLGSWTTRRRFEIRARRAAIVLDLRSTDIPMGDIEVDLDVERCAITLLVAERTVIDQLGLAFAGRGKVKQTFHHNPTRDGRRIRLVGAVRRGEVRVLSGGIAQLSVICSRQYFAAARRAHAAGRPLTLDDPGREAVRPQAVRTQEMSKR